MSAAPPSRNLSRRVRASSPGRSFGVAAAPAAAAPSRSGAPAGLRRPPRGSSPPPIPPGATGALVIRSASEASGQVEDRDDTQFAPPPHAAALDAPLIEAGDIGEGEDPTAILEQEHAGAAVSGSSTGHPVVEIAIPAARPGRRGRRGRIRHRAGIPRRGGMTGDLRYLVAAIRGVIGARRGLAEARREVARERAAREGELMALARRAVATLDLDIELVETTRDRLSLIEERRAQRSGRVAAADEDLTAIERQRVGERDELAARRRRLDAKLVLARERLGPLLRRGAVALRRAGELEAEARVAERRVALSERKLYWIRGPRLAGVVESGLRDQRAELEVIEREQAEVAAELDDVEPAIANLQSLRADLCVKLEAIDGAEQELDIRAAERLDAARAARRVHERAASEADRDRDELLRDLAERLATERPVELESDLARLDERELAIATYERHIFEHTELIAGLDRRALARAAALIALVAGVGVGAGLLMF